MHDELDTTSTAGSPNRSRHSFGQLGDNMVVQYSVLSLALLLGLGGVLSAVLTLGLTQHLELLEAHSVSMLQDGMQGAAMDPDSPASITLLIEEISELRGSVIAILVAGFGISYLALVTIVHRGWSTILPHRAELKRTTAELKEANQGLEAALTELEQAQNRIVSQERLSAVGQLATGIAHDFNNLLVPITLYSEILLDDQTLSGGARSRAAMILKQASRAAELTDQILDFSRRTVLELEVLDLGQLLEETAELLRRTLPDSISVQVDHDLRGRRIYADPTRMQQVLMNLSLNARDAMPSGGELKFAASVERQVRDSSEASEGGAEHEWIRLEVSDTGEGIPASDLPRIFEPFFTTKDVGAGSGLGLAQVYGIMKQLGGRIDVDSEAGVGTTFSLLFPPAPEQPLPLPAMATEQPATGQLETVLVVEDDPGVRQAVCEILQTLNYRVEVASSGLEALEIYKQHSVDVVLSDMVMPGMGAAALLEELQRLDPQVRMIIMSGYPPSQDERGLLDDPMVQYLSKPLRADTLAGALGRSLNQVNSPARAGGP